MAPKRITTDVFVDRAKGIHGDRYDYSRTEYINSNTKLVITCREHGDFEMLPGNHTHKTRPQNCQRCSHPNLYRDTNIFIEQSKEKFGDKFDYSKTDYKNSNSTVIITCDVHGKFTTTPSRHLLSPTGCGRCSNEQTGFNQRKSQDEVIQSFISQHGDRYDYSKVEYRGDRHNVLIICSVHGEFWQRAIAHANGRNCNDCMNIEAGLSRRLSREDVIQRAIEVHGSKYDYSKFEYNTIEDDMIIICPEHGEFVQRVNNHINQGNGCRECALIEGGLKRRISNEDWIVRFREVHGDTYDYSDFESQGAELKSKFICKEHGLFLQAPITHSNGVGCPDCGRDKAALQRRLSQDDVLDRFREVHGETYDYSLVEYIVSQENVTIICKKHGPFEQLTHVHANGAGCPKCSRIGAGLKRRLTINDVLERFREAHGERFDYSEFVYRSDRDKATIICREHGPFEQSPADHWSSVHGCARCAGKNQTTEGVIEEFRATHGDRYDYSDFTYRGNKVHSTIICSDHGPFEQVPHAHRSGQGCPDCGKLTLQRIAEGRRLSNEVILEKFREVHGDGYDYSRVEYTGTQNNVTIVCEKHGPFEQAPNNHLAGSGCPDCAILGFRNNQPGYYYCLSILGHGGHWWFKGGISGDPNRRARQIQSSLRGANLHLDVVVVDSIRFERGIDARNLESKLLREEDIRAFTIERFDGSRELFSFNPIEFARTNGWV